MKILVISDTHGNFEAMRRILEENPCGCVIHLGDGERDFADCEALFPMKPMIYVCGNCDYGEHDISRVVTIGGVRIFCTHGHMFNVRTDMGKRLLALESAKNDCLIALYGHTHISDIRTLNGVQLMNPGSPSFPRGGNPPSFGMIDISDKGDISMEIITPEDAL